MNPEIITTTQAVDPVFMFIFAACLILLLGITGVTVWFVVRYHRSRSPQPTSVADTNIWLELIWTLLPTLLVLAMFYYGWSGYLSLRNVPAGALPVTATARMWSWSFTYDNGRTSSKLYVPLGKPVLVNLVSLDVVHGFYLPAFRVKRDVVPGMRNQAWFVATKAGSYDLFCSSYCGTGHSGMISTVVAIPEAEFREWLNREDVEASEQHGMELLEQHGCLGCHSLDGSAKVGPSFRGIWGRKALVTTGGIERSITVDEAYLLKSIREPGADLVKGYQPVMPAYLALSDEEVKEMVEYIRSIR